MKNKLSITHKKIWKIAYPIILGSLAQNIIGVTDTAFLGHVGEVALGAGAIGSLFYMAVFMLGWGFSIGSQIIIARRFGEKKMKEIGRTFDHGLLIQLTMALVLFLIVELSLPYVLGSFISSEEIYGESMKYIHVRAFGFFFAFFNVNFRAFFIGISRTKAITYTTFVLATFNVIFDYLLVFGHYGFPKLGVEGAAYASLIAEIAASLFFFSYAYFRKYVHEFSLLKFKEIKKTYLVEILRLNTPMMLQSFISLSAWFFFFLMVEKLGERPLAISNIIRSIYVVIMLPVMGFSSAANSLVSFILGENRQKEVFPLLKRIAGMSFWGVGFISFLGFMFPETLLSVYTNNVELIQETIPVFRLVCGSAPLIATGFVVFNGVSGTGRTDVSMWIEILVISFYLLYAFFITQQDWANITWVWSAEYLYSLLLIFVPVLYLKYGKWQKARV